MRFAPLLLLALAPGCAKQTTTFTGTVSCQGKPLTGGAIYFLGPAPEYRMGMGTIREDGTYSATDVPVGDVRVSFQAAGVPPKYADPNKSELVYTITSEMRSLDITAP